MGKTMEREIRAGVPVEIREAKNGGLKVEGYAAVFNQEADIGGMFREKFLPGAFADAIGRDDVVFLVNHEGLPLARTRSKTLTLEEDKHGLRMATTLDPEDPDVKAIAGKMKRGDLDKMSIAFFPEVQTWDESDPENPLRTISRASLYDVSVVTTPAYDGTEIALRSLEKHRDQQRRQENFHAARKRRMGMHLALTARENGRR